jgi:hypothetical protein
VAGCCEPRTKFVCFTKFGDFFWLNGKLVAHQERLYVMVSATDSSKVLLILEFLTFEIDVSNVKNFVSAIKRLSNLIFYLLSRVSGDSILTQEGGRNARLIKSHNGMVIYVNHQMSS